MQIGFSLPANFSIFFQFLWTLTKSWYGKIVVILEFIGFLILIFNPDFSLAQNFLWLVGLLGLLIATFSLYKEQKDELEALKKKLSLISSLPITFRLDRRVPFNTVLVSASEVEVDLNLKFQNSYHREIELTYLGLETGLVAVPSEGYWDACYFDFPKPPFGRVVFPAKIHPGGVFEPRMHCRYSKFSDLGEKAGQPDVSQPTGGEVLSRVRNILGMSQFQIGVWFEISSQFSDVQTVLLTFDLNIETTDWNCVIEVLTSLKASNDDSKNF